MTSQATTVSSLSVDQHGINRATEQQQHVATLYFISLLVMIDTSSPRSQGALFSKETMVCADNGLSEPDNPEDFTVSNEIYLESDNESDQDSIGNDQDQSDQYESLPSSAVEEPEEPEVSDEESFEASTDPDSDLLPFITPWTDVQVEKCDIEMDSKKIEDVKQAMMNITLPPEAIPEWAASVPEDDWKQQLYKRLEHMQEKET